MHSSKLLNESYYIQKIGVPINSPRTVRHVQLAACATHRALNSSPPRQKFAANSNLRFTSAANMNCNLLQRFYPYVYTV